MSNKNELFKSIEYYLMNDKTPSNSLNYLSELPKFKSYPFSMLLDLQTTKQSPLHHPEGNVWNHTMLVVDQAARRKKQSKNATIFMWAALLHDIGKPATTKIKKGKITSYDHDKIGADLSKEFLSVFTNDDNFIKKVSSLIKFHMQILFVTNNLPFADLEGMRQETDIHEVALLGLCDRLGRTNSNPSKEERNIQLFLSKTKITK